MQRRQYNKLSWFENFHDDQRRRGEVQCLPLFGFIVAESEFCWATATAVWCKFFLSSVEDQICTFLFPMRIKHLENFIRFQWIMAMIFPFCFRIDRSIASLYLQNESQGERENSSEKKPVGALIAIYIDSKSN